MTSRSIADRGRVSIRSSGAGFAAGMGKAGAAVGLVLFPLMQSGLGLPATLMVIAGGCVVAGVVTLALRSQSDAADEAAGVLAVSDAVPAA
jgi:hypothetical protein